MAETSYPAVAFSIFEGTAFKFELVTRNEFFEVIDMLSNHKSAGSGNIKSWALLRDKCFHWNAFKVCNEQLQKF